MNSDLTCMGNTLHVHVYNMNACHRFTVPVNAVHVWLQTELFLWKLTKTLSMDKQYTCIMYAIRQVCRIARKFGGN